MEERKYDISEISDIVARSVEQALRNASYPSHIENCINDNTTTHSFADISKGDHMSKRIRERVQVGVDAAGTPIYKWATGSTMQEVFESASRLLRGEENASSKDEDQRLHNFREYADKWFKTFKKPSLRDITAINYQQQIVNHIYPAFGDMNIEDITPADVQDFLNQRIDLAKDTQQKQLNIIRMILQSAVEDGIITNNPARSQKVKLTSSIKTEREPLSRDKMQRIIENIPKVVNITDRCFIAIQALHGMRPCEVLGLQWKDIDLDEQTINIKRDVVHPKRNRPVVSDTKTAKSKRSLNISNMALPYIKEAAVVAHADERPDDFVFGGDAPLTYMTHRRMMERICKQLNISGVTGYTFRHTIITEIYESTHDANIAAAVAGHSKTSTTMNIYTHARRDSVKIGMTALDEAYSV